jgi:type I restriction enzyme S subunit
MMELGKILTYQKGKSPQRVHSSDIQVLYLTPEYLRGKSVPQFIEDFPNKVEVENGDLLLLWDGSNAGEVFRGKKGVLSSTMVKFDFDSLRYHRTFLFYQLKGFEGYLKSQTNGSGIPHVDRELLLGLKIQLFTEVEQTKIANILSTADEAIAQTEQLIAKYQRIKTGLMQDLLTKGIDEHGNIRNKTTHKFVVKNGVEVPEEWEVEVIDDVAFVTKLAGYEYTKFFDYSIGGEIIALRALNIKNEEIVLDNVQTIPRKTSDLLPRSKISKGDILLTYIGAYIGDVLLIKESNKYHLAPNIAKITSDKKMSSEYMEILLRSYLVQSQMQNLVVTTATPSLTMGQIRKIKLVYPIDPLEQKKIVDTFVSLKNKIRIEQMNLQKIRSLKTGLMQDLLSGRVRVNM